MTSGIQRTPATFISRDVAPTDGCRRDRGVGVGRMRGVFDYHVDEDRQRNARHDSIVVKRGWT